MTLHPGGFIRRLRSVAPEIVAVAAVLLAPIASAQDARPHFVSTHTEEREVGRTPLELPVVIEGYVLDAHGLPVSDAVVVSSAGGQTVSESDGRFRLEVAHGARGASVNVTAVASGQGGTTTGSVLVSPNGSIAVVGVIFVRPEAGCSPEWLPTFGGEPGVGGYVNALAAFDDGGGAALYVGGAFTTAGGMTVNYIAKWDGVRWSSLDGGMTGTGTSPYVHALAVFDDGNGPALYAGGGFRNAGGVAVDRVAKWNGSSWSALSSGLNSYVSALTVCDDGSGPALYVGGGFTTAGGIPTNRIAKWNGSTWSALGSGMNFDGVQTLAVFDDGGGPALFAGGGFTTAGGVSANRVAKWNGSAWSALSSGMDSSVEALAVFDDGSGSALYAGGAFTTAGGVAASRIAKWNGSSWSTVGSGMSGGSLTYVRSLTTFDDGGGPALYVGGDFTSAGGVPASRIAKWNGASWSALGSGIDSGSFPYYALAITGFDDGSGPALYVGGSFTGAGGLEVKGIAKWKSSSWSVLSHRIDNTVEALTVFDDGSGTALYAGGTFTSIGGIAVSRIAKWNGSSWSPLGSGMDPAWPYANVLALAVFDDGSGPALYAGGDFATAGGVTAYRIARWNGSTWSALGSGMDGDSWKAPVSVHALAVFDDGGGPALYAGGWFSSAGGVAAYSIAKWNGSSWSALELGVGGGPCGKSECYTHVFALTVFDDGSGPALYAGGNFTNAGSVFAKGIAKWNGSSWSVLSGGMEAEAVYALTVFDDGGGPALYAGGYFLSIGIEGPYAAARWNGASWSELGIFQTDCCYGAVLSLTVADVGRGPALYAGGDFTFADSVPAKYIAKLGASGWSPLGSGMTGDYPLVQELIEFDDGDGRALYAGGWFTAVPDSGDSYLARWRGCRSPIPPSGFAAGPGGTDQTDD